MTYPGSIIANRFHLKALLSIGLLLGLSGVVTPRALAQNDVQDQGGPVMQAPTVQLIFWLPPGFHFDPSGTAGDTTFENLMVRFFNDISGSGYLNIMSQYPGVCGPPNIPATQSCFGAVTVGNLTPFVDTRAYPHAGTVADPLSDADIRTEVTNFITANSLTPGLNMEFFVFTGANVNECASFGCTGTDFCAYHGDFQSNGNTVLYAFMPNDNSFSGCDETISSSPNQLSADREIIAASHEFAESLSDPRVNDTPAWNQIGSGAEIGDICVPWQSPSKLGSLNPDGSNVNFNGHPYVVQEEWSNNDAGCVLSVSAAIGGPSIEYTVGTGSDDLRGDSSTSSNLDASSGTAFQTLGLKSQSQPGWDNNSTHVRVLQINQPEPSPLGNVAITLTSHDSGLETPDNWNIQNVDLRVRNANGSNLCFQAYSGNPLARLTGQAPTAVFPTPTCAPPPPPTDFTSVSINIATGNDDARKDSELWATFPGEPAICLKPSNNADSDGVCNNGGSATDQNGQQDWANFTSSSQTFALAVPQALDGSTITITLIEHNSGFETDDNWDIQGITLNGIDSHGNPTLLLSMSNPPSGDNCMARLKGAPNPSSVTYNLSAANPAGSNLANPTFGPTPPGSCPQ